MRYFLIMYCAGNLGFIHDRFPRSAILKEIAGKFSGHPVEDVVITNIFEFKNKEDFDSFEAPAPEVKKSNDPLPTQ